jgi:hypothetical protein
MQRRGCHAEQPRDYLRRRWNLCKPNQYEQNVVADGKQHSRHAQLPQLGLYTLGSDAAVVSLTETLYSYASVYSLHYTKSHQGTLAFSFFELVCA